MYQRKFTLRQRCKTSYRPHHVQIKGLNLLVRYYNSSRRACTLQESVNILYKAETNRNIRKRQTYNHTGRFINTTLTVIDVSEKNI